jgi:hypothetical protein
MNVFGIKKGGGIAKLVMHTEKDFESPGNIVLNYQDRIIKGDIIANKIKNSLKEDFGFEEVLDIEFTETPKEEFDELSDEIFDYSADIHVKFNTEAAKQLGDVHTSWIDLQSS